MLKMAALMLAMTMTMPLISCGDDDDDDDDDIPVVPPTTETSHLLKSITGMGSTIYTMSYDAQGRLTRLNMPDDDDPFTLEVSYSPLKLRISYGQDETSTLSGITTNKDGYITSARVTETYDGQVYSWNTAIQYDNAGHIISMTDDDETMYYDWTQGDLTSISSDDGIDYSITYSSTERNAGVFSPLWEPMGPMWLSGLFGQGPAHFPSSISDGDDTISLAYKLYYDGAIDTETVTINGISLSLTYNYADTRATASSSSAISTGIKHFNPFRHAR